MTERNEILRDNFIKTNRKSDLCFRKIDSDSCLDYLCEDCLCDKFYFRETIENTDADGNRGLKVVWRVCDGCGNES